MSNIYLYVSQHWVMAMLKISFNIFLFFYFSRKTKLNFSINFSNLSAFMYSLMIHTQYIYCSSKELVWRTHVGLFTLDLALFTEVEMHLMWMVLESQRYFNFIPQIFFPWFTSDHLSDKSLILPICYTIKILLNLR